MLSHAVVEALYYANYVNNYLDCIENFPNDVQRFVSRLRELDSTCQSKFLQLKIIKYIVRLLT